MTARKMRSIEMPPIIRMPLKLEKASVLMAATIRKQSISSHMKHPKQPENKLSFAIIFQFCTLIVTKDEFVLNLLKTS
jgi:hypothetical protein